MSCGVFIGRLVSTRAQACEVIFPTNQCGCGAIAYGPFRPQVRQRIEVGPRQPVSVVAFNTAEHWAEDASIACCICRTPSRHGTTAHVAALRKPASLNQRLFNPIELPGRLDGTPDDCTEIDRNYSRGADILLFRWGVPVRVSVKERRFLLFFSEKAKSRQEAVRNISHDDGELK